MPKEDWNGINPNATKLAVSLSAINYLEERTESLPQIFNWVSNIFINATDSNSAQIFTHIHEIAHTARKNDLLKVKFAKENILRSEL